MSRAKQAKGAPAAPGLTVYERRRGWASLEMRELWRYRELLYFLSWRDIKVRYRQAILGAGWVILQPLLTMLVFTVVFNKALGVQSPDKTVPYAVFSLSGLVIWQYFSGCLARSGLSLVGQANLLTKVYFPRLVIPMASVFSGLIDLVIALVILFIMMGAYGIAPGWELVFLPLFILLAIATALAVGLWLSSLNVLYRDVQHMIPFLVQLWMFLSPVIYPISRINNEALKVICSLNPMTGVIDGFRWSLLGQDFDTQYFWYSLAIVAVLLAGGLIYFKRVERVFADVV